MSYRERIRQAISDTTANEAFVTIFSYTTYIAVITSITLLTILLTLTLLTAIITLPLGVTHSAKWFLYGVGAMLSFAPPIYLSIQYYRGIE